MKTKQFRLIALYVAIAFVIIGSIIIGMASKEVHAYRDEAVEKANLWIKDPSNNFTAGPGLKVDDASGGWITSLVASLVIGLFFFIFAGIYLVSRNKKVQMRRWPYIVMIVLGVAAIGWKLWQVYMVVAWDHPNKLPETYDTPEINKIMTDVWTASYKSHTSMLYAITLVCSIIPFAANIAQMVMIKKMRNNSDSQYSEQVRNFQPKQNDLP